MTVASLANGTAYAFEVRAVNDAGAGDAAKATGDAGDGSVGAAGPVGHAGRRAGDLDLAGAGERWRLCGHRL